MILILTNDDGIDAPRIQALQQAVNGTGIIVAPTGQFSGCGHQVTTHQPLRLHHRALMLSEQVLYIYLDELLDFSDTSLAVGVVQLVVGSQQRAREKAKPLLERTISELTDEALKQKVIELIERILIYKFTNLTREELEAMFSISDLKETRFYQEGKLEGKLKGKLEGKLESIPRLLALGLNVEQIAQALDLEIVQVQQVVDSLSNNQEN
ncbi:transposase [Aphanothece hegewaldii CCALA 016]|uniref:5'-nucleotidase n=1 Tax=Aphanothece hegewaldii CCALA 016 TaxID=2107694 RepID=A0A2T1LTY9_9CHRO|nr:DUF2887 domain-containing protein [Aphanothece hegewaldii]PSF34587.1 transposase [Aphanothece hegewaldii CCALA 016]